MKRLREFLERYERHLSAGSILIGFAIDSLTLERIDLYLANLLLITYLLVVAFAIVLVNLYEAGRLKRLSEGAHFWLRLAMQFSFGGLFGRFLVYYGRSGSFYQSWPLILIFLFLLIGNELARKYYSRLRIQISFFFLALFVFLIFYVPILIGRIGADVFLISGLLSLGLIFIYISFLTKLIPERLIPRKNLLYILVGSIYFFLNVLYFTNIIPPIPLSLREAGVYHSVQKYATAYRLEGESKRWYEDFRKYEQVHLEFGKPLYLYSAVFAPTDFGTQIVHRWQYFDEAENDWVDSSLIKFPIVGGADRGYRGYSLKTNISPGLWRVDVATERGQVVGRVNFKVEIVDREVPLFIEYR